MALCGVGAGVWVEGPVGGRGRGGGRRPCVGQDLLQGSGDELEAKVGRPAVCDTVLGLGLGLGLGLRLGLGLGLGLGLVYGFGFGFVTLGG